LHSDLEIERLADALADEIYNARRRLVARGLLRLA
jgi:hypothetical protein